MHTRNRRELRLAGILIFLYFVFSGHLSAQISSSADQQGISDRLIPELAGNTQTLPEDSLDVNLQRLKKYAYDPHLWKKEQEPYRQALIRLIWYFESNPVDSVVDFLKGYPYPLYSPEEYPAPAVKPPPGSDTLPVKRESLPPVLRHDSLHLADSIMMHVPADSVSHILSQDTTGSDTVFMELDTLMVSDTQAMDTVSEIVREDSLFHVYKMDTIPVFLTDSGYVAMLDTLRKSVTYLIRKVEGDSVRLWVSSLDHYNVGVWLRNQPATFTRFWVKNEANDSIGLWIQNLARDSLRITLDDNVIFHRLTRKEKRESVLIPTDYPDGSRLIKVRPVVIKKNPWKLGGVGEVNLSQGMLSNWAKGGESSVSSLWVMNAYANYQKGIHKWSNTFRFKYGILKSGDKGVRKNEDVWELDSQFGVKKSTHWFYSAGLNLKSQIARGYKYPDDSTVVSRFFAPGYLFLSVGMDYQPNKIVSIMMSPLTGRITFVTDTVLIDQTRYGLRPDKRVRQDVGAYIKSQVVYPFSKDMSITSRLNLFSQYNSHPLNIDVDWEVIYRMRLGPYFNINVSTHMIYDDNIKFPVYDASGQKVGEQPRLQFKEWLNIGFAYRFGT